MHIGEHNIWWDCLTSSVSQIIHVLTPDRFFDDIELLRQKWQSANMETVAELYALLYLLIRPYRVLMNRCMTI